MNKKKNKEYFILSRFFPFDAMLVKYVMVGMGRRADHSYRDGDINNLCPLDYQEKYYINKKGWSKKKHEYCFCFVCQGLFAKIRDKNSKGYIKGYSLGFGNPNQICPCSVNYTPEYCIARVRKFVREVRGDEEKEKRGVVRLK